MGVFVPTNIGPGVTVKQPSLVCKDSSFKIGNYMVNLLAFSGNSWSPNDSFRFRVTPMNLVIGEDWTKLLRDLNNLFLFYIFYAFIR